MPVILTSQHLTTNPAAESSTYLYLREYTYHIPHACRLRARGEKLNVQRAI